MQRKAFLIAIVGVAAVLVTAAIAFASGGELSKPETIRVNQTGGKITFLPLNTNKKTFVGDLVVVNGPVFDTGATKVGLQHAVCTLMDKRGIVGECSITTFLKAGSIAVRGPVHFGVNDQTRGAITGGTGKYRNARGQVVFINSTANTEGFLFQLEP